MEKSIEIEFSQPKDEKQIPEILSVNSKEAPSLRKTMEDFTEEYVTEKGNITCEFSTNPERIGEVMRLARDLNKKLEKLEAGWIFYPCRTCESYKSDSFIHCEIAQS